MDSLDFSEGEINNDICFDIPNTFWKREEYVIDLPFVDNIRIKLMKASASLMSLIEVEYCKIEIADLLEKGLIEPARSQWACRAFYVNKHSEIKRGKPRMVIKYKPLNSVLKSLAYPLPNQASLLQKLKGCTIFSKFDLKYGFYQVGIKK